MFKKLTPKQRIALIVFNRRHCEICFKMGNKTKYLSSELEINRIKGGYEGGLYSTHNITILCKPHHKIISQAQRISLGIQN